MTPRSADELALRADAIAAAVAMADSLHVEGVDDLPGLLSAFYRQVALEDVLAMNPIDLLGIALSQLRAAAVRAPRQAIVNVYTPTVDEHGWSNGHTVVEVVAEDMPFLVDSLSAALSDQDRGIHLVIHPQYIVQRDDDGQLQSIDVVQDSGGDERPLDAVAESWIHFDIDRDTDAARLERLRVKLESVLGDVRGAVEDWPAMSEIASELAADLADDEAAEFLSWLAAGNFTFLGYREYDLKQEPDDLALLVREGTGLGILRENGDSGRRLRSLPLAVQERALNPDPLVLTKANSRSTVHRSAYMDYVGIKTFDESGTVVGERRFLGLYTAAAYNQSILDIPVIRAKTAKVMADSGLTPESHSGKDLQQFLETYPRDEVFQAKPAELLGVALAVLGLQERRRTRLFLRRDPYGRFMSCLVYLPRDRYTTTVRRRIEAILRESLNGESVDYRTKLTESVLARLHFVVHPARGVPLPDPDHAALQAELEEATKSWDDEFHEAIIEAMSEEDASAVESRFAQAIPVAYKEAFPARTGVADIRHLASLPDGATEVNLYYPYGSDARHRRLKIYRCGSGATLSQILPLLQDMGAEVTDERPFVLVDPSGRQFRIYDVGVVFPAPEVAIDIPYPESAKERLEEAFIAGWQGRIESDRLNSLVLMAGLNWKEVVILRAFAKYMRQAGSSFSPSYFEKVLLGHTRFCRLLIDLFHARFDPDDDEETRAKRQTELQAKLAAELDAIQSLDIDRILRGLLALIQACTRTSYYREIPADDPLQVSFKFLPREIPDLPEPRPLFEIWVYSPVVEGVHLRFAQIARGGIRWSDRPEDFRTEVLGLAKAQAVKNSVIVPAGAKGGFFAKLVPESGVTREARAKGGRRAYRDFITGLLDLTDNRVAEQVVPPRRVVRHDGDDPYLVVAADKGTATFSDLANSISRHHGFWLGDAFASGGSDGYDHKAMGITARGAWESVRRHFRELGVDTQTEDFTCVGIGDMSGDVFGNGMLLSEHIHLTAAFDHRHIFLDPNPDPVASFSERRRLFELERSSWADYDSAVISEGGGVYPRTVKSIPVTPQVARSLGLSAEVKTLRPSELIRLILTAPVDLFWNGGIGTYVKSVNESDATVGDRANDQVRVNGRELRCLVVGEGGNLGLTQLGRIEAAQAGVRLNTDAIDNSAGVDTSDHEVNLKILLDEVVASGDLTLKQRNELLQSMTDTVADLVLRHNYAQNTALGNARGNSDSMLSVHERMLRDMAVDGQLDRELERLPGDEELLERAAAGGALVSPELCVLLAYAKMTLADQLENTPLVDDPYFSRDLTNYFPPAVAERFPQAVTDHPLAAQIVTTSVVSEMVNRGGITFAYRAAEETSADTWDIVRAFTFAKDVFGLPEFWMDVAALDNEVATDVQRRLYLESRRLLDRATRWLLHTRGSDFNLGEEVERYAEVVAQMAPLIPDFLLGVEHERMEETRQQQVESGVPEDLANTMANMLDVFALLDVTDIATRTETTPDEVAPLYYCISERYHVDTVLTQITRLDRDGRWRALARQALRSDLYQALASLTAQVVRSTPSGATATERLNDWEAANKVEVARLRHTMAEISKLETYDLATLSVVLRAIRTLVAQARS